MGHALRLRAAALPATLTSLRLLSVAEHIESDHDDDDDLFGREPACAWRLDAPLAASQLERLHTLVLEDVGAATLGALAALRAPLTALRELSLWSEDFESCCELLTALPRVAPALTSLHVHEAWSYGAGRRAFLSELRGVGQLTRLRRLRLSRLQQHSEGSYADDGQGPHAWTSLSALTSLEFGNVSPAVGWYASVLPKLCALRVLRSPLIDCRGSEDGTAARTKTRMTARNEEDKRLEILFFYAPLRRRRCLCVFVCVRRRRCVCACVRGAARRRRAR
jgi:hypothetical protein